MIVSEIPLDMLPPANEGNTADWCKKQAIPAIYFVVGTERQKRRAMRTSVAVAESD